jgi:hypothetical protein
LQLKGQGGGGSNQTKTQVRAMFLKLYATMPYMTAFVVARGVLQAWQRPLQEVALLHHPCGTRGVFSLTLKFCLCAFPESEWHSLLSPLLMIEDLRTGALLLGCDKDRPSTYTTYVIFQNTSSKSMASKGRRDEGEDSSGISIHCPGGIISLLLFSCGCCCGHSSYLITISYLS